MTSGQGNSGQRNSDQGNRAVVVAVAVVLMVQVPIDEVIDVVSMRHGLVAAIGSVHVASIVAGAAVTAGTAPRVRVA